MLYDDELTESSLKEKTIIIALKSDISLLHKKNNIKTRGDSFNTHFGIISKFCEEAAQV